jgi:hypothetical protein
MSKPKLKIFHSTPDIKISGDNMTAIFCPQKLVYSEEDFKIYAGETVMVVPLQPDNKGPWQSYRTAMYNHRLVKNKAPKSLCFLLTNRWLWKTIMVTRGCRLDWLLSHPGIHHTMGYLTERDMINIIPSVKKNDDFDDDDDDDDDDENESTLPNAIVHPISPTPRLGTDTCHQCCHNVEIIRP